MDTPHPYVKVALFLLGLAAVFAASVALGSAVEPAGTGSGEQHGAGGTMEGHATHEEASDVPAGLGIAADGYTLRSGPSQLRRGEARELHFSIDGAGGEPITHFDELHERRMHLIVVRRDGTGFRHLHPEMDAAGTWTVPVEFAEAGVYRAFTDFSAEGEQRTLATDVFVSGGEFAARPFPAPQPVSSIDGYEVRLRAGEPVAGESTSLAFAVREGAHPVDDLAPYLGAKGHLVALREGDLAFLHVHPEEGSAASEIVFDAIFPTAGRYRLYLQFWHGGAVHTAEFTVAVGR